MVLQPQSPGKRLHDIDGVVGSQAEPAVEPGSSPLLVRNVLLAVAAGLAMAGALTFLLSWKNRG